MRLPAPVMLRHESKKLLARPVSTLGSCRPYVGKVTVRMVARKLTSKAKLG